jgi:hypothetical protein
LRPQKPGDLVGAVEHLRHRLAHQLRGNPAQSRCRELGHRRRLDGPAFLRNLADEVAKGAATSDRQIRKCHSKAHVKALRRWDQGLLNLGDHCFGQKRHRAPADCRVTQLLDQSSFVTNDQI